MAIHLLLLGEMLRVESGMSFGRKVQQADCWMSVSVCPNHRHFLNVELGHVDSVVLRVDHSPELLLEVEA